ncbi:polycystic kidney disease 2-like 2 protein [Falco rusticolus]|uniref:polycystic kidney disease 2-like 2 protein n=1 Tax=Falco rusticolus TaxID=120794 RepID=UPI001886751C|nr:polycystic kidney disease 2-like 2 protein [Falco rusticolus]XP_055574620.1 polycystic kidney disease 2-like 2 protein [Falco cherrug]
MEPAAARQRPAVDPRLSGSGATRPPVSCSPQLELKTTLWELVIYIIFLIDLCIVTFSTVSTDMYYLNKVMSRLFLEPSSSEDNSSGFSSIRSRADFWRFAEGPLLDGLYWEQWYNNTTLTLQNNSSHIYYENLLLGVAQIRQLKVRNNTCSIYPYFRAFLQDCYGEYRYGAEDRSDFGLRNKSEWKYTSAPSLSPWYWGSMGLYSSGGYMFNLPKSKQESVEKLVFLRQNSWLTRGTRAVFIDFSTYNANVNLFCIIRLVVEFPATGGALTSSHIYSVKLLRYITYYDYFLASCEVTFCLFIITFIIHKAIKIVKLKKEYFRSAWNWLDLLLLVVSVLAIALNIYCTAAVSLLMEELLSNAHVYPDFYFLGFWQVLYNNIVAVNIFFAWIKVLILEYVQFNKSTRLPSILSRCAKDIIGFAIIFFIIFFAYAQLGYLIFGSQVEDFSTFQNCIFTQLRLVLGDFNFDTIEAANRVLGPIYFITFVFFVFFTLLNMFLAIINDTYSEVKADFEVLPSQELRIRDFFRQSRKALVKLKLKKPEMDTSPADESLGSTSKDISKLSNGDSANEKSHLKLSKLKKGKEKRGQKYAPTEGTDSVTAQSYVSTADFQWLFRYTVELQNKLDNTNAKIRRIMKSMELKDASRQESIV